MRFVFQPAQAWDQGTKAMIRAELGGRLGFDPVHGLHCEPCLPVGALEARTGPSMAA